MKKIRKPKYAIFSKDVLSSDKYRLTHPPKKFFDSREQAHSYAKKMGHEDYKIMTW